MASANAIFTYPNLKMSFLKPIETEILNLHRKCKNEKKLKTLVSQKTLSAKTNVFDFIPLCAAAITTATTTATSPPLYSG